MPFTTTSQLSFIKSIAISGLTPFETISPKQKIFDIFLSFISFKTASYTILEGYLNSKNTSSFSISNIIIPYDINKEIEIINKSDFPLKNDLLLNFKK